MDDGLDQCGTMEGDEKWSDTVLFKGIIDGFAGGLNVLLEKRIQDDFIF